jgi:hypothetical protein
MSVTHSKKKEIFMQRFALLLMLLLAMPNVIYGSSVADIGNVLCSGGYSSSLQDNASFVCGGDLTLSNGSIASDEKVIISSVGSLFIGDLQITAPIIEIYSQQGLTIGSSVFFYSNFPSTSTPPIIILPPSVTLTAGGSLTIGSGNAVDLISGGNITLTAVPLPTSSALMLSAILLCLVLNAGRKKPLENAIV